MNALTVVAVLLRLSCGDIHEFLRDALHATVMKERAQRLGAGAFS